MSTASSMREKAVGWGKQLQTSSVMEHMEKFCEDAKEKDGQARTLLHGAVETRQAVVVEELYYLALTEEEVGMNARDRVGRTPLMLLMRQRSSRRSVGRIASLLSLHTWAEKDSTGRTCLHYFAARAKGVKNARDVCEVLGTYLKSQELPLPIVRDHMGNTPLHYIARQKVCTYRDGSRFEETAATVITKFLIESFPGMLGVTNDKGLTPLVALARSKHRDPLVCAVKNATAEELLARDANGWTFLSEATGRRGPSRKSVVESIPLDVLRRFDIVELLGAGDRRYGPLAVSLHSYERAMCIFESMDEDLSELLEEERRDMCRLATLEGTYRVVLYLMKKDIKCFLAPLRDFVTLDSALSSLLLSKIWREEETAAALEILQSVTDEQIHLPLLFNLRRIVVNDSMPDSVKELLLHRAPTSAFAGNSLEDLASCFVWEQRDVFLCAMPESSFSDPAFMAGILRRIIVAGHHVEEMLAFCTDEALVPRVEPPLLHRAIRNYYWRSVMAALIMRAPHLRNCTSAIGETVLDMARREWAAMGRRGEEMLVELDAMLSTTLTKSALE